MSPLSDYELGALIAYQGKAGCRDPRCTRGPSNTDGCYGWHCPTCDEPCSMMGHRCAQARADNGEASATTTPAASPKEGPS